MDWMSPDGEPTTMLGTTLSGSGSGRVETGVAMGKAPVVGDEVREEVDDTDEMGRETGVGDGAVRGRRESVP